MKKGSRQPQADMLFRREEQAQRHAKGSGHDDRDLLARGLPGAVEPFVTGGGNFGQIDRYAAQFHSRGKTLKQAAENNSDRSENADEPVRRRAGDGESSRSHKSEGEDKAGSPSMPVDVRAQNNRAERAHEIAGSKSSERQHQRSEMVAGGKNVAGDVRRIVGVDHEVVHFEEIAAGDADDGAYGRADFGVGHFAHVNVPLGFDFHAPALLSARSDRTRPAEVSERLGRSAAERNSAAAR